MAFTAPSLAADIKTELASVFDIQDEEQLDKVAQALAAAFVRNVKLNALVTLDSTATVTTGPGAGGTVVGTGKIS